MLSFGGVQYSFSSLLSQHNSSASASASASAHPPYTGSSPNQEHSSRPQLHTIPIPSQSRVSTRMPRPPSPCMPCPASPCTPCPPHMNLFLYLSWWFGVRVGVRAQLPSSSALAKPNLWGGRMDVWQADSPNIVLRRDYPLCVATTHFSDFTPSRWSHFSNITMTGSIRP